MKQLLKSHALATFTSASRLKRPGHQAAENQGAFVAHGSHESHGMAIAEVLALRESRNTGHQTTSVWPIARPQAQPCGYCATFGVMRGLLTGPQRYANNVAAQDCAAGQYPLLFASLCIEYPAGVSVACVC